MDIHIHIQNATINISKDWALEITQNGVDLPNRIEDLPAYQSICANGLNTSDDEEDEDEEEEKPRNTLKEYPMKFNFVKPPTTKEPVQTPINKGNTAYHKRTSAEKKQHRFNLVQERISKGKPNMTQFAAEKGESYGSFYLRCNSDEYKNPENNPALQLPQGEVTT